MVYIHRLVDTTSPRHVLDTREDVSGPSRQVEFFATSTCDFGYSRIMRARLTAFDSMRVRSCRPEGISFQRLTVHTMLDAQINTLATYSAYNLQFAGANH